ncbi:hypothetical protein BSKO_10560 [Bryopsis sp. KO-2023]|nr:hypothetical protein BSKO_10560 [Bryopsis sp. KO-2023]
MHNHLSFAVVRKKTPYQKHREKEEDKKRRAKEEEARLYEDFVESFRGEDDKPGPKAFVRGGTMMPGTAVSSAVDSQSEERPGEPPSSMSAPPPRGKGQYVPSFIPPSMAAAMEADEEAKRLQKQNLDPGESGFPNRKGEKGRPKNIDLMLETLKRDQEIREERFKQRKEGRASGFDVVPDRFPTVGSFADGDPYTTNLYVGNLAPDVDEEILKREFGRFGPIASVKIMWPRDEEQRRRGSNCGFVAFMKREDAQSCQEKLNGEMLHEYELRIGWGKSVPIPPVPVYPPPNAETLKLLQHPGIAPVAQENLPKPKDGTSGADLPDIDVHIPDDGHVRYIIDTLACYVLRDGCALEQLVMEREGENAMYQFLFDLESPEHAYYRWRLFSLAQGDGLRSWRIEPFVMVEGGPRWVPPTMCVGDGSQMTAAQKGGQGDTVKYKCLSDLERDRFEDMLRSIKVGRQSISEAMVFALDNAEAAHEVVDIVVESLTLPETPVQLKVVRLFLVSDILHNSTAPVRNASQYRSRLEERLPDVFESFRTVYASLDSKMTQEAVRRHVLRVLRVWRNWFIFSNDYLNGLQATFLRPVTSPPQNPTLLSEFENLSMESLERKCRHSGLSSKGHRPDLIERLLALDAYLNGQPKSDSATAAGPTKESNEVNIPGDGGNQEKGPENEIGVAVEEGKQNLGGGASGWMAVDEKAEKEGLPTGPISKWILQEQEDARQASGSSEKIFSDAGSTPVIQHGLREDASDTDPRLNEVSSAQRQEPEGVGGAARMEPEEIKYREKMRKVEVAVMEYCEELEEKGLDRAGIEEKVSLYRQQLRSDVEREKAGVVPEEGVKNPLGGSRPEKKRSRERNGDWEKDKDRDRDRVSTRSREREKDKDRKGRERQYDGGRGGGPDRTRVSSRPRSISNADGSRRSDRGSGGGKDRSRSRSPVARRRRNGGSRSRH